MKAIGLSVVLVALSALPLGNAQPRLTHADYIRCTAHLEQASMKLLLGEFSEADTDAGFACAPRDGENASDLGLTRDQTLQLAKVVNLFSTQLRAPTPTVHMKLTDEIATFVEMLD